MLPPRTAGSARPGRPRSRVGPPIAVLVPALALAAGAAPAAALEAAIDPLDAARCAAYGGGGAVVADADAGSGGPRLRDCVLPTVPTSEVLGGSLRPLFERLDLDVVQVVDDPANDLFSLTTGEVGSGDPATDVIATYFEAGDFGRREARDLVRFLDRQAPDDWVVVLGDGAQRAFAARGGLQVFVLETAADPTTWPDATRSYQLAFMGTDPATALPSPIPTGSPLMGARWAATYGRFVTDDGLTDFFAASDFFGKPLSGSDSAFYNLGGQGAAIATPGGIVMLVPASLDPVAFRPTAFDQGNGLVDIVGLGGPFGYVPADGTGPGLVDWQTLGLVHQSLADQTFTVDGKLQQGQELPSFVVPIVGSPTYPFVAPPPDIGWGYTIDGRAFFFDVQDPGAIWEDTYAWASGIPSYGNYCLTDYVWRMREDMRWSDGEPITQADIDFVVANLPDDVRRAMGTYCWVVTQTPGVLGSPGYEAWWPSQAPDLGFATQTDAQTVARLAELGWVEGPDGMFTFQPPDVVPASD